MGFQVNRDAPRKSRLASVALVASIGAAIVSASLCSVLVASQAGWIRLGWSGAAGVLSIIAGSLLVVLAVAGAVCGYIVLRPPNRHSVTPAVALALGVLSLAAVPFTALLTVVDASSEDALMKDFREHREQFEASIDAYNTTGSRTGLLELGIEAGAVMGEPGCGEVYLPVEMGGMSVSGWERGYVYSEASGLPRLIGEDSGDEYSCQRIEGPWYVYYWAW